MTDGLKLTGNCMILFLIKLKNSRLWMLSKFLSWIFHKPLSIRKNLANSSKLLNEFKNNYCSLFSLKFIECIARNPGYDGKAK